MATKKVAEHIVKSPKLESSLSKRKQFNQIQFDPKILQSIKTSNIGKFRAQVNTKSQISEHKSDIDKV